MFDFTAPTDLHDSQERLTRTVYLLDQFGDRAFLSQMPVLDDGEIGEAHVIDPNQFIETLREAQNIDNSESVGLIDQRLLVKNSKHMVWMYTPTPDQPFYYRHMNKRLATPINWPTLVFKRTGQSLSVCVLQHKTRPSLNTRVYHAPLPNVYKSGSICLGGCVLPMTDDIDAITEEYLNSVKTHLNFDGGFRGVDAMTDKQYFQYIQRKTKEKIKVSELTPFGTLKDFIA
ncbi:hypothetical protein [Salinivibrio costicola]|jgi:hypothetical protein|uniref:hypothetical protein n=1 Tax=Salinivibrio costicola TaxID=51367 RepID=UPI003F6E8D65